MLTKILFTALLIAGAVFYFRKKKESESQDNPIPLVDAGSEGNHPSFAKFMAYALVALTLISGIITYYINWQDDHRLYEVNVINPKTGSTETYKAFKKDLHNRWFITTTGQQISISELERMEFEEINEN